MGVECQAIERKSSLEKGFVNKNSFEKKFLVGKGGFSKVT